MEKSTTTAKKAAHPCAAAKNTISQTAEQRAFLEVLKLFVGLPGDNGPFDATHLEAYWKLNKKEKMPCR
ncbi:MAG: hypothetical protein GY868_19575 [Deltaproteobacteria bacterium]|nr:hypothetical protein [Deltaproteobacteria bacterium]